MVVVVQIIMPANNNCNTSLLICVNSETSENKANRKSKLIMRKEIPIAKPKTLLSKGICNNKISIIAMQIGFI